MKPHPSAMTPAQALSHQILDALRRFQELNIDEATLKAALRAFPNKPGDQMLFILGTLVSQGKVPSKAE